MDDFASAVMLSLLSEGMRMHGLQVPLATAQGDALVALDEKRALLQSALVQAGPEILPRLGRGVHALRTSHLYTALLGGAADAPAVLRRWCRLERYVHSRHRTAIVASGAGWVDLHHHALPGFPPPQAAEDLVLLGVQAALLELAGCASLAVLLDDTPVWPVCGPDQLQRVIGHGNTGRWRVTWDALGSRFGTVPAVPVPGPDPHWPAIARRVFELLAQNLMDAPSVAALAVELQVATRSLQRTLTGARLSCRYLLAEARLRHAGKLLLNGGASMAEIGLVCGYADQAHFIRDFHRRTGMSPGAYRACFKTA